MSVPIAVFNVFFTLFLGLAAIYSISGLPQAVFRKLGKKRLAESKAACAVFGLPLCALCYYAAYWMDTDYGEYRTYVHMCASDCPVPITSAQGMLNLSQSTFNDFE